MTTQPNIGGRPREIDDRVKLVAHVERSYKVWIEHQSREAGITTSEYIRRMIAANMSKGKS